MGRAYMTNGDLIRTVMNNEALAELLSILPPTLVKKNLVTK